MSDIFDVAVIGGGPGGYVAAIRAAQLGMKVACIDKRERLGGTCLNVGCIPSKALLDSSEKYEEAGHKFKELGIEISGLKLNFKQMMQKKDEVVTGLTKGIDALMAKNKITKITGLATIGQNNEILLNHNGKTSSIKAKNIIIATGSEVTEVPGIKIDEKQIISSDGALALASVPKVMVVIGGGYIGLELGSVYRRLGSEVYVIEYMDRIVPAMDMEVSKNFEKILAKQGMKFMLGTKVNSATIKGKQVELELEAVASKEKTKLIAEVVLVSVGRKPHTKNLGLEELGVALDDRGRVIVDESYRTNKTNIYAIGDVIKGPMLAHKAEEEGVAVAEIIAGLYGHVNYGAIPGVVYTWPEVASVGKTEEEVKAEGIAYQVGKFPFLANSRARAVGSTEGFVKVISCQKTDKILGAHIIGPDAGTLIAELVLALEYSASSEDIVRTSHAHPTLNEAVREATMAVLKRSIHS